MWVHTCPECGKVDLPGRIGVLHVRLHVPKMVGVDVWVGPHVPMVLSVYQARLIGVFSCGST